jgi:hypothetical protein
MDVPWMKVSERWVFSPVPIDAVVARSTTAVLYLHLLRACPEAIAFRLLAVPAPGHIFNPLAVTGAMTTRIQKALAPPGMPTFTPWSMFKEPVDPLSIDVEFSDGTRASFTEGFEAQRDKREPRGYLLLPQNSGNDGGPTLRSDWLVWPLPPPEPVRVITEWGDEGIPRVSHVVDGAAMHQAAKRSQRLLESK